MQGCTHNLILSVYSWANLGGRIVGGSGGKRGRGGILNIDKWLNRLENELFALSVIHKLVILKQARNESRKRTYRHKVVREMENIVCTFSP